jgi:hypothetical protein
MVANIIPPLDLKKKGSPPDAASKWAMAFADAWHEIADGKADMEYLFEQGCELFKAHGGTAPEVYAQQHFDEADARHQNRVRDPLGAFTALAAEHGIIKAGDKLDQNLVDFAYEVVALCAKIGDGYGDPDFRNAGEHIRAVYGPL